MPQASEAPVFLSQLYSWSGPLMSLAYLPQIRVLWRTQDAAHSTSLLTWCMWVLGLGITTAYALQVNGDAAFITASACSLAGSTAVLILACCKRWRYRRPKRDGRET